MRVFFLLGACLATQAYAETAMLDSATIQQRFTPELAASCLKGFAERNPQTAPQASQLHYNEQVSREVYDRLFWKHGERGVAFTAPMAMNAQEGSGTLACFYSLAGERLAFDYAQALPKAL